MSDIRLTYVRHTVDVCQTYGWRMSDIRLTYVRHTVDICQTYGWHPRLRNQKFIIKKSFKSRFDTAIVQSVRNSILTLVWVSFKVPWAYELPFYYRKTHGPNVIYYVFVCILCCCFVCLIPFSSAWAAPSRVNNFIKRSLRIHEGHFLEMALKLVLMADSASAQFFM